MYEEIAESIIEELSKRYNSPESRKKLRLNVDLVKEIFDILNIIGYEITPSKSFPTEGFSATAIDNFYNAIERWVQASGNYYIPAEQILRDLLYSGWIIKPPKGL